MESKKMKTQLRQPQYHKDSVEIIQLLRNNKRPATISELVKQIKVQYNPERINRDLWTTFKEKISIGVNCGYILIDQERYSLVYPLPAVDKLIADIYKLRVACRQ